MHISTGHPQPLDGRSHTAHVHRLGLYPLHSVRDGRGNRCGSVLVVCGLLDMASRRTGWTFGRFVS